MGFFSDLKALSSIQKIKVGKIESLSISQIVNVLINLPDAEKKLSKAEFDQVHALFKEYRTCKTKIPMDMEQYCRTAIKIIKSFDTIAPYEKYSGGNELEFSFFMEEIKGTDYEKIRNLKVTLKEFMNNLRESDRIDAENKKILQEAFSDEVIEKMIREGRVTVDWATEYKRRRENLEAVVAAAPEMRRITCDAINTIKKQIHELEHL